MDLNTEIKKEIQNKKWDNKSYFIFKIISFEIY